MSLVHASIAAPGTYPVLEGNDLLVCQSVRLGNDWDQIDFGVKSPHHFNIKWL